MKILIRVDGGFRIGMGHVMRMLVLADKLKAFAEVVFVCRKNEEYNSGIRQIEAKGYKTVKLDESQLVAELTKVEGDCLITDSYDVDESYFITTKKYYDKTGYMDDLNKGRIYADFIINQNIYAKDLNYKADVGTRLLLGIEYALLRDEFQGLPERSIGEHIENVLITLGGADPDNMSGTIAARLGEAFPRVKFHVVVGPSFIHQNRLYKNSKENIQLHYSPKMSELMLNCDAAITACGSTVYELCACGIPMIGIVTADNQNLLAQSMKSTGLLKYADKPEEIIQHLHSLDFATRAGMSRKAQKLVDGFGSTRLSEKIREIICEKI